MELLEWECRVQSGFDSLCGFGVYTEKIYTITNHPCAEQDWYNIQNHVGLEHCEAGLAPTSWSPAGGVGGVVDGYGGGGGGGRDHLPRYPLHLLQQGVGCCGCTQDTPAR